MQATNSSSWRSFKLFASEALSVFCTPKLPESLAAKLGIAGIDSTDMSDISNVECGQLAYPDITWVPPHCNTKTSRALWEHQLSKLGLDVWSDRLRCHELLRTGQQDDSPGACRARGLRSLHGVLRHVCVYIVGTDAGADQVGVRNQVETELSGDLSTWIVWTVCLQHQMHLLTKRQLSSLSTYFSNMAKCSNCWRAPGNAAEIFRTWVRLFGLKRAKETARNLPPRVLKGRFGAIHKVESLSLEAGMSETSQVFTAVLSGKETKLNSDILTEDADGEDFRAKVGRWRRDAIAAASDSSFWITMCLAHITRGPSMHLTYWLEKEASGGRMNGLEQLFVDS